MENKPALHVVKKAYGLLIASGTILQSVILAAFRFYFGWRFYSTGIGKLQNHSHVVEFFTSLGIPAPELNAWFVGGVETVGGILLILGLLSRPIGVVLSINMLVAYISVTEDRAALLGVFSDPEPFMAAAPFFFLLTALLMWAFGPGLLSVDALLKRKCCRCCGASESCDG